jgi:hypothetical protein
MASVRLALVAASLLVALLPAQALGFSGFGQMQADGTYGTSMTFGVRLNGGAPDSLEIQLRFGGDDSVFIAPVAVDGDTATYTWDTADQFVTPNTSVEYSWRATDGNRVSQSPRATLLYDDDRFDWRSATVGNVTIHWYGGNEAITRDVGATAAHGVASAEELLGHDLAAPMDLFMYANSDDFFGALGPGAREWTGAATYPGIRTIFMNADNARGYLETTATHEVTHVVFDDATGNPFHEPAKWLNEGLATWAEQQNADSERSTVQFEASGGGLFAFEAISQQFPIGDRQARLAYAQGATMIDMIVSSHGRGAIAAIASAYRDGASDTEALRAGTGESADQLYADYYDAFGVDEPQPVTPGEIKASSVRKAGGAGGSQGSGAAQPSPGASAVASPEASGGVMAMPWLLLVGGIVLLVGVGGALVWAGRRGRGTV